jgi:predicted hotdog family 3-hydroxylacyl-ACP dehydratase
VSHTLSRAEIGARIPHSADMCLLDGVVSWSDTAIHCVASSQQLTTNPLRAADRLGVANGIEYAAQAMAVHGALTANKDDAPRAGFLTSVREVEFHTDRLDGHATLDIHAERLSGDGNAMLYSFCLSTAGTLLLAGRASVMLDAKAQLERPVAANPD